MLVALKSVGIKVIIKWVKVHVGITGNEAADMAARVGAQVVTKITTARKSDAFYKAKIKQWISARWKQRWTDYDAARQSKQFYSESCPTKAKILLKSTREDLSRFVSLITGHNSLNYHSSLIDSDWSDSCRLCMTEKETFFHWVTTCPRLQMYRNECFLDKPVGSDMTWSIRDILRFSYKPGVSEAIDEE